MRTRMRITAAVVTVALSTVGAVCLVEWLGHRLSAGVVSAPDDGEYGFGIVTRDLDEKALSEVKTPEDFKRVTGLRIETTGPTPSPWAP